MKEISCKLLVLGAGPGGYVCAIRAGQLGVNTVIVEKAKAGGTCLNVGCIPSKALIHAAEEFHKLRTAASGKSPLGLSLEAPAIDLKRTVAWKDGIVGRLNSGVTGLLKKAGVKAVIGQARFVDGKTVDVETEIGVQRIRAEAIVIATGSAPVALPDLPFGDNVISSTEALALKEVPQTLAVIGGGYIGLELGTAFAKLGSKVTVLEAMDRILPQYDADLSKPVMKRLGELGIEVFTRTAAKRLSADRRGLFAEENGRAFEVPAEKVLVTVGRRPVVEGWGWRRSISTALANSSVSTTNAAPRCAASMRSATSPANRCSPTAPSHRGKWSPKSSPARSEAGTSAASRPSASPIRRSSAPVSRRRRRVRPGSRSRSASSPSRRTAAP